MSLNILLLFKILTCGHSSNVHIGHYHYYVCHRISTSMHTFVKQMSTGVWIEKLAGCNIACFKLRDKDDEELKLVKLNTSSNVVIYFT